MEEKKSIQISVTGLFLVVAIIVIIIMGFFMYKIVGEKNNAEQKVESLNGEVSTLESSMDNLQDKIDSIANTISSTTNVNTANQNITTTSNNQTTTSSNNQTTASTNTVKIEGTYENREDPEIISYTFSGNKVTYEAMDMAKGTYEIEGDKIKITYQESYDPEGNKMNTYPNGQKEELTIVNENTLTNQYGGKYVKK